MRHSHWVRSIRLVLVLATINGALLGCSLSFNTGSDNPAAPSTDANGGGGARPDGGVAPVVRISDPSSGTTIAANQRLDITVQTDTTATRFQLTVSGQVASTIALPQDQSGATSAILSWTPQHQGTYTLQVIAFNDLVPGPPADLLVTVSGTASGDQSGSAGICTGRALVSQLNFRSGPGTSTTILGQFQTGEITTVLGRNSDNTWFKVQRMNAQQVWAINNPQWFQTEGQCSDIAVLN